ncbi:MAG TPA: SIR2 family protein [Methylophilaceae bacterium]|jgi:hypothetical protein
MELDPLVAIQLLRNHLATHDQTLAFLFGAGTSASINIAPQAEPGSKRGYMPLIPAVIALTIECGNKVKAKGKKYASAWDEVIEECKLNGIDPNIESILSRVRFKISAIGPKDSTLGLNKTELQDFESSIRETINTVASPTEANIPNSIPHKKFSRWIKQISRKRPVEIFTTNYDILIERSLEKARVPVFDGFTGIHEPFFNGDCFENSKMMPPNDWIRLWKIHGSINWKLDNSSDGKRVIRVTGCTDGEMILPSHQKYDESRKQPYQALIDRFIRVLKHDCSLLVTAGYNFGDQHLDSVIYDALDNHPLTHVISLQFENLSEDSPVVKQAIGRPNFIVLGRNGGVLRGQWGVWRLKDQVDKRTANFLDIAFDSDAVIDKDSQALTGQMRLGDFNYFCSFLTNMEGMLEDRT